MNLILKIDRQNTQPEFKLPTLMGSELSNGTEWISFFIDRVMKLSLFPFRSGFSNSFTLCRVYFYSNNEILQ